MKLAEWREKEKINLGITDEQLDALIEIDDRAAMLRFHGAYVAITNLISREKYGGLLDGFGIDLSRIDNQHK